MNDDEYHFFRGRPQKSPFWIGKVQGLKKALDQMNRIAETFPDDYFICTVATQEVVAAINQGPAGPIRVMQTPKAKGQAG